MPTDTGTATAVAVISGADALIDQGTITALAVLTFVQASYVTVSNPTSRLAYPTITIEGPCTNPLLVNETVGRTLAWHNLVIDSGDTLIVDHKLRTVMLSVSGDPATFVAGIWPDIVEWWELMEGDNQIQVGGTLLSGSITMNVDFRYI